MARRAPTFTCTAYEAAFLARLLGASMLLGLPDPFSGWLVDEVQDACIQARTALAKRNAIEIQPNGALVIDTAVAALVSAWAFAQAVFIATRTVPEKRAESVRFFVNRSFALKLVLDDGICRLTALEDAAAIHRQITTFFHLTGWQAAPCCRARLAEAQLLQADAAAGAEATQQVLREAGIKEATATLLAQALAQQGPRGSLVAMARRTTTWEVCGLALWEAQNGLWGIRPYLRAGANWVEVIPTDAAQSAESIRRLLNRVLPEPLPTE